MATSIPQFGDLGSENCARLLKTVQLLPDGSVMIDLGVRLGVSSRILMDDAETRENHVYGVEAIGQAPELSDLLARKNYHFISGDSVTTGLQWSHEVNLCMFDTFHFAEHVLCELYAWWTHIPIGGWCVFHDTAWSATQHDVYAGMTLPHVIDGIREFCAATNESFTTYPDSFGMTFLQRRGQGSVDAISDTRWRERFAVRRKVMNTVNLPIKWEDILV